MIFTRNRKKQSNKRGAMLILVMLIVALAVILISSALMMTRMTRSHYYQYTKMSQAQLTATSVAESIWDAIVVQAIDDESLLSLADGDAHLDFSGVSVPGMMGGSNSTSSADFSMSGGKVIIDVVSVVGSETAKVRMILNPPVPTTKVNHFLHTVNMDGDGLIGDFTIGNNAPSGVTNNTILLRGEMTSNIGSTDIYSTLIATKPFTPASGQKFYSDVVFWGPASGWSMGNGAGLNLVGTDSTVFFVSPDGTSQSALRNSGANDNQNIKAANVVFYNSVWSTSSKEMWNQLIRNTTNIYYDSNAFPSIHGEVTNDWNTYIGNQQDGIQNALKAKAKEYVSAENQAAFSGDSLPTLSSQRSTFGIPSLPVVANVGDLDDLSRYYEDELENGSPTGYRYLKPGRYDISAADLSAGTEIICDLSKGNYVLDLNGSGTIAGQLKFVNGDKLDENWGYLLAENGVTVSVTGGVVSLDNGGVKPHVYMYGYGGVTLNFPLDGSGGADFHGYVCLYDDPGQTSEVRYNIAASCNFVGRITCHTIRNSNGGGHVVIPYCVDPTYKVNGGKIIPLETKFTIEPFQYYN